MSQRKSIRDSAKKQPPSKPSSTKPKILFSAKPEREVPTVTKNLLREFNQLDQHNVRPQKSLKSQHSIKETDRNVESLEDESSVFQTESSRMDKYEFSDEPTGLKRAKAEIPDYAELQLPRSYILAMRGLQEAVEQREKEARKLKKILNEQTVLTENTVQQLQVEKEASLALQTKLSESLKENKFYRQTIMEMKEQAAEQLRAKINLEKDLKTGFQTISQLNVQVESLKREIEASNLDKTALKQQLQKISRSIEQKKNEYNELLLKRSEQFSHNYTEVVSLRQELTKLKDQHEKNVGQIAMLKEEVGILSDRLVIEEAKLKEAKLFQQRAQLQKFERELQANRQILQEVTFDQNCLRQAFNASSPNTITKTKPPPIIIEEQQVVPTPTPVKQLKEPEQSRALDRSSKQERPSTLRQERSVSRLRQTNNSEHPDRRELIGQMRELMRHEKELISLNYQMEVLERGMLDANPIKREQTQRTYARLRRNIEKKQADVRELKSFIDKATTNTLK